MDNSNIIISIIIVLCIAAGVTAYGISEGDDAVFSDLTGFSPDGTSSGDDGIGNSTSGTNGTGLTANAGSSSSGGSNGGSPSGSGGGSGGGANGGSNTYNGGGSSGNGGSSGSGSSTTTKISSSEASTIASGYIGEEGAYVGAVVDTGTNYLCKIYDANGNWVDAIVISYSGENLGRG